MGNQILVFTFLLVTFRPVTAQPVIQWQKTFGGSEYEEAMGIQPTREGGYVVAGITNSNDGEVGPSYGNHDIWILKLDSLGGIQWKRLFGGSDVDEAFAIQQTTDEGFVVAGLTGSTDGDVTGFHGYYDALILKLDKNGNIQWHKCLGGSDWEEAWDVHQTADGGYIVVGRSGSTDGDVTMNHGSLDFWVVKLDSIGAIEWQKSLGGSALDLGYSIEPTTDGGYIVAGETYSTDGDITNFHGNVDCWIVKLNFEGKIQWQKALGGTSLDRANDVHQTQDGGYIVFGTARSNNGDIVGAHGGFDSWVVKLSTIGTIEWELSLGGSSEDYGQSIIEDNIGGFVTIGTAKSNNGDVLGNHGSGDVWVTRVGAFGELQWQKAMGGTLAEWGNEIAQTSDGGFILTGYATSNNGDVSGVHGYNDFWVVKLSPESTPTSEVPANQISIYPNPAQASITIKLPSSESKVAASISDLLGREVIQKVFLNSEQVDVSALGQGFYLLTATTVSGQVYSGKFWKE